MSAMLRSCVLHLHMAPTSHLHCLLTALTALAGPIYQLLYNSFVSDHSLFRVCYTRPSTSRSTHLISAKVRSCVPHVQMPPASHLPCLLTPFTEPPRASVTSCFIILRSVIIRSFARFCVCMCVCINVVTLGGGPPPRRMRSESSCLICSWHRVCGCGCVCV